MNSERKDVLKLALDHAFGATHADLSMEQKRKVTALYNLHDWPGDGFLKLAQRIVLDAISNEGPFASAHEDFVRKMITEATAKNFRDKVIEQLARVFTELEALELALTTPEDFRDRESLPLKSKDQITGFRAKAGTHSRSIHNSLRREFGLPELPSE